MKVKDFSKELEVLNAAAAAAADAAKSMLAKNPDVWYPCGFSWVKIRPARGPLIEAMKHFGVGHTDEMEGGYVVYNPSGNNTQWMDAKMAGSRAYAELLNEYFKATDSKCVAKAVERVD
jgi:hypothetical protein